ncbi:hypothetical protein PISMIDRAFT_10410 [Pisolithus microcarpus 441]|uniref:Uncharacterized protein n=1 Tax=Pisolithus microcarpus 441 TaxID=765257 RepID=A0A0C9ZDY7_9AGAM|nr:hypothetical protein BKA83DRAFT_10410 [Pisolithus microcarpus]KIK24139.1 hypothetical protein PISMIDRAFT_10410 [Pisolithus microcarpus 441]
MEEEKECLRSTKTREGFNLGKQSTSTLSHHADVFWAMAKRHLETVDDAQQHVWHQKHTRSPDTDIPTREPDLPETDHSLLDDEVDEQEVPPTPDLLNAMVDKDALPFIPDHSDAENDTQLDENFSLHVHDAPDAV